jgi:flagellar export protein FliJ
MSFRFPLQAVLNYRANLERREYLTLGRVHQQVGEAEIQLQQAEELCAAATRKREAQTVRGVASVHLQEAYQQELGLEARRDQLRDKLKQLRITLEQCRRAYEAARQKREVMDELRIQRLDAYRREQGKQEQRRIDDLFLSRRRRGN